jgi:hypothetical protein
VPVAYPDETRIQTHAKQISRNSARKNDFASESPGQKLGQYTTGTPSGCLNEERENSSWRVRGIRFYNILLIKSGKTQQTFEKEECEGLFWTYYMSHATSVEGKLCAWL